MTVVTSRTNKQVRRWRGLVSDRRTRHEEGCAILEGPHLVTACLHAGKGIKALILSASGAGKAELAGLVRHYGKTPVIVADSVFRILSDAETPAGVAAEFRIPDGAPDLARSTTCVFLERVQDPGNVGAILRSAAAFGIRDVVLGRGCADAWSPKVLRAAMGAHFSLCIAEEADLADAVERFGETLVCTAPREGTPLPHAQLPTRIGWIFGAEGQGVSRELAARARLKVTIPMAGLAESLNVAAAAAVCFYEAAHRRQ